MFFRWSYTAGAFPIKNGMLGKLKDPTLVILGLIANSEAEQLQEAASLVSQVFSCPHNKPHFRADKNPALREATVPLVQSHMGTD